MRSLRKLQPTLLLPLKPRQTWLLNKLRTQKQPPNFKLPKMPKLPQTN